MADIPEAAPVDQKRRSKERGENTSFHGLIKSVSITAIPAFKKSNEPPRSLGIENTQHVNRTQGFADMPPALQGFFFVLMGFGLVVAATLLGSAKIISTILIIGGFGLVAFGFYRMISQL